MTAKEIIQLLKQEELRPASKRKLSLFSLSCVGLAYTKLLQQEIGFNYRVIGTLGQRGDIWTLFNEAHIAQATGKLFTRKPQFKRLIKQRACKLFTQSSKEIRLAARKYERKPNRFFTLLCQVYPKYFLSLGLYNCYFRYLGDKLDSDKITKETALKIAKERDNVAKFYFQVERMITSSIKRFKGQKSFYGDLLRYLTLTEMKSFLMNKRFTNQLKEKLTKRQRGYFYFFYKNQEHIFCNQSIIQAVKKDFFLLRSEVEEIKGISAYPGIVKGVVYKLDKSIKISDKRNLILVTNSTKPEDLPVIKKCLAVVTDEGGILGHTAVITRELKKPCVIGTKIATQVLKDGDLVEVDADQGIIKVLKK